MYRHRITLTDADIRLIVGELEAFLPTLSEPDQKRAHVLLTRLRDGKPGNPDFGRRSLSPLATLTLEDDA